MKVLLYFGSNNLILQLGHQFDQAQNMGFSRTVHKLGPSFVFCLTTVIMGVGTARTATRRWQHWSYAPSRSTGVEENSATRLPYTLASNLEEEEEEDLITNQLWLQQTWYQSLLRKAQREISQPAFISFTVLATRAWESEHMLIKVTGNVIEIRSQYFTNRDWIMGGRHLNSDMIEISTTRSLYGTIVHHNVRWLFIYVLQGCTTVCYRLTSSLSKVL